MDQKSTSTSGEQNNYCKNIIITTLQALFSDDAAFCDPFIQQETEANT